VQLLDVGQVFLQWLPQLIRQQRQPILSAFALANDNMPGGEIEVFDPQLSAFQQTQTGTVEQAGHKLWNPAHLCESGLRLLSREHDRKTAGTPWPRKLVDPRGFNAENVLVQEHDGAEGLLVRGGARTPLHERVQKGRDVTCAELTWMLALMEFHEPTHPGNVGAFGAHAVVPGA
jgi:hypothetical protein